MGKRKTALQLALNQTGFKLGFYKPKLNMMLTTSEGAQVYVYSEDSDFVGDSIVTVSEGLPTENPVADGTLEVTSTEGEKMTLTVLGGVVETQTISEPEAMKTEEEEAKKPEDMPLGELSEGLAMELVNLTKHLAERVAILEPYGEKINALEAKLAEKENELNALKDVLGKVESKDAEAKQTPKEGNKPYFSK